MLLRYDVLAAAFAATAVLLRRLLCSVQHTRHIRSDTVTHVTCDDQHNNDMLSCCELSINVELAHVFPRHCDHAWTNSVITITIISFARCACQSLLHPSQATDICHCMCLSSRLRQQPGAISPRTVLMPEFVFPYLYSKRWRKHEARRHRAQCRCGG